MSFRPSVFLSHGDIPEWIATTTESLMSSLLAVDPLTYQHSLRVGEAAHLFSKALGLSEYQQAVAHYSGLLHDIGKMGVPTQIIHKADRLTNDEYARVKEHSEMSEDILKPLTNNLFFQQVAAIVRSHHERMDGMGYPDKLNGDEIPLFSRLILVVDTMDAMSHDRPYRKGASMDSVYSELTRCAGSQFDLHLVKEFLNSHGFWAEERTNSEISQRLQARGKNLEQRRGARAA